MKRFRNILALVMAAITALALSTAAFATEGAAGTDETGSITIDNAVNGYEYKAYEMLYLESHNDGYSALSYKVTEEWKDFFETGAGADYVVIDEQGYVTWKNGASAADFAEAASAYAASCHVAGRAIGEGGAARIDDLQLGYYLVQSGLGAICSLDTTTPDVTIKEKNAEPTIEKEVQEDSTGEYGKTNDASVGDTVNFRTTVKVIDGQPKGYKVIDQMSDGLTLEPSSMVVKINGAAKPSGEYYTVDIIDDHSFNIIFVDGKLRANDEIVIEYSAIVNANAVIADAGNPNKTYLEYTDTTDTKQETEVSKTVTYVWDIDVFKYAVQNGENQPLSGATFVLNRDTADEAKYAVAVSSEVDGVTLYTITDWTATEADATPLVSPASGKFSVAGLDEGCYYLTETEAPAGYNKLADPVKVIITSTEDATTHARTATVTYGDGVTGTVNIENKTGKELPSTGGMGTTVLYVLGGALVLGAGVALVTRRRMAGEER